MCGRDLRLTGPPWTQLPSSYASLSASGISTLCGPQAPSCSALHGKVSISRQVLPVGSVACRHAHRCHLHSRPGPGFLVAASTPCAPSKAFPRRAAQLLTMQAHHPAGYGRQGGEHIVASLPTVHVTTERRLPEDLEQYVKNPGGGMHLCLLPVKEEFRVASWHHSCPVTGCCLAETLVAICCSHATGQSGLTRRRWLCTAATAAAAAAAPAKHQLGPPIQCLAKSVSTCRPAGWPACLLSALQGRAASRQLCAHLVLTF